MIALNKPEILPGTFRNYSFLTALLFLAVFLVSALSGSKETAVFGLVAIALLLTSLFSFDIAIILFTGSLFFPQTFQYTLSVAFLFSFVVIAGFLITFTFKQDELKSWILKPMAVFLLCVLPSLLNSLDFNRSLFQTLQFVPFTVFTLVIMMAVSSQRQIRNIIFLFIAITLSVGLFTSYLAAGLSWRYFGPTGITFVDICGLTITLCVTGLIYSKNIKPLYLLSLGIAVFALIMTRTRNPLIVVFITLIITSYQFRKDSHFFGLSKNRGFILLLWFVVVFIAFGAVAALVNPETIARFTAEQPTVQSEDLRSIGSLTSRLMLWSTALNGFMAHPFIGIGFYSFPTTAKYYSTLAPILHQAFVQGLTPHNSYIAIIAETGIVGFYGFLFLITSILKQTFRIRKRIKTQQEVVLTALLNSALYYILLGLFTSDSWLCGNLIMVWALFLGLFLAQQRLMQQPAEEQ